MIKMRKERRCKSWKEGEGCDEEQGIRKTREEGRGYAEEEVRGGKEDDIGRGGTKGEESQAANATPAPLKRP